MRKLLILANGSVSVTAEKRNHRGYYGFFSLRNLANWLMYSPNNFINQLAEYCQEEHILVLDGPGSDITEVNGSLLKSIGALVDGHIGSNGISANLEKIKQFITKHAVAAEEADEPLLICGVGWSRGGFVLSQMREWLEKKSTTAKIKVQAIHLHFIDTVIGGPTDRLRYAFKSSKEYSKNMPTNLSVHSYFSNNGNLNLWEAILECLPPDFQINTPFFSGTIEATKNMTYSIDNNEYKHQAFNWLFPATHEGLIGKPRNKIEQWAGDIVIADIVRHLLKSSFKLNEVWTQEIMETGQIALEQLREESIMLTTDRKFLDLDQPNTTILGRELVKDDNMYYVTSMRDFS